MFQREWRREGLTSSSSSFLPPGENVETPESAQVSSDRTIWDDFSHVPYEPVRIDRSHDIILMPIDPFRIWAGMQVRYDDTQPGGISGTMIANPVLRVMDITGAMLRGSHDPETVPDYTFDIQVGNASSWYIPLWNSHRFLVAHLGWFHADRFVILARSNTVRTPSGRARRSIGRFLRRDPSGSVITYPPLYPTGYFGEEDRSIDGKTSYPGYYFKNHPGSIPSSFGQARG